MADTIKDIVSIIGIIILIGCPWVYLFIEKYHQKKRTPYTITESNTGTQYIVNPAGGITPILNKDGTPFTGEI